MCASTSTFKRVTNGSPYTTYRISNGHPFEAPGMRAFFGFTRPNMGQSAQTTCPASLQNTQSPKTPQFRIPVAAGPPPRRTRTYQDRRGGGPSHPGPSQRVGAQVGCDSLDLGHRDGRRPGRDGRRVPDIRCGGAGRAVSGGVVSEMVMNKKTSNE